MAGPFYKRCIPAIGTLYLVDISRENYFPEKGCRVCGGEATTAAANEEYGLLIPCHNECFHEDKFERLAVDLTEAVKVFRKNPGLAGKHPDCQMCAQRVM